MNIIFIFLITFIIAYLFGIVIVNLIDNRLSKIQLNLPKQDIVIKYPESIEKFENKTEIVNSKTYNFKTGEKIKNNNHNFDNEYYKNMDKDAKIEGYTNTPDDSFKGWNIEEKKMQNCFKNHIHNKKGNFMNCTYGVTNYADPNDLSPIDYKIFKLNYPSNMTLQDYVNWLYCFLDKEDELPYNHLKNLEKLKMGKELKEEHGILPPPGYMYPPQNAKDYFDKMYNSSNEFNIAPPLNSITGPMIGYNYNDYSEFSQNLDFNGSSGVLRNPDIGLKKNVKKLYNYINPKDSNSLNLENQSEIYRIKNVEV
jgi:hypothetical protein